MPKRPKRSPEPATRRSPSWALWLAVIAASAFALRLIYLFELRHSPFFQILVGDGREYDRWAQEIAGGQWIGTDVFYQSPLYPYLLAVVYAVAGHHVFLVRLLQALLGSVSCVLLGIAGRRFFAPAIGLIAAGLLAIYPPAIFFDGLIQKSSLDVALMTALLALCGGLIAARRWPALLATGVILGLLMLNRENARVLVPVVGLWLAVGFPTAAWRERWRHIGMVLAGVTLVIAPVMARNGLVSGQWLMSTSQLGPNFYIGNHAGASGTYDSLVPERGDPRYERADATHLAETAVGHSLTASGVSGYWLGRAFDDIRSDPSGWLALMARKFGFALHAREIIDTESIDAFATHAPLLQGVKWVGFGWMLPLGVLGAWLTRRDWRRLAILYLVSSALLVSTAIFYVVARYRLPIVPPILLFAAAGVEALLVPRRHTRLDWVAGIAAAGIVAIVVRIPTAATQPDQDSTYFNYGETAVDEGNLTDGIPLLEHAATVTPNPAPVLVALGAAYERQHDTTNAIARLTEAVKLHPESAYAQYDLGLALDEAGRSAEGAEHVTAAVKVDPTSARYRADLGMMLTKSGRTADGIAQFRAAIAIDPSDADVHDKLGAALAQTGHLPEAIDAFRTAIRLKPDFADAHGNLAIALELAKDTGGAADEFAIARRLAPSNAGIALNHARFLERQGRIDAALTEYSDAARLDPDSVDTRFATGAAYARAHRWIEARSTLTTAATLARSQNRMDVAREIESIIAALPKS